MLSYFDVVQLSETSQYEGVCISVLQQITE